MKAKRLFSVIIAMMLMLSCFAVTASADTNPIIQNQDVSLEITLLQPKAGVTIPGDASDESTHAVHGNDGTYVPADYDLVSGSTFKITQVDPITKVKLDPEVSATGTTVNGVVKFTTYGASNTKLPKGRYYVENTTAASTQSKVVASFYVDLPMTNAAAGGWIYDVKVYPKVPTTTNPTVTKQVKEEGAASYGSKASIDVISGKKAQWKIEGSFPTDIATYTTYTLNDDIVANLGSAENVTATFYDKDGEAVTTIDTEAYTLTGQGTKKITFTISDFTAFAPLAGGKVVIEFKTAVNAVATKIPNDVELTYNTGNGYDKTIDNSTPNNDPDHPDSDSPNDDPSDEPTPSHDPYVWTGKIDVVKVDSNNTTKKLQGVKFKLFKGAEDITTLATGDATKTTLVTDANGKLPTITGLGAGTYYLREVETLNTASNYYELLGYDVEIQITEAKMFAGNISTLTANQPLTSQNTSTGEIQIKNTPSQKLPLTGGMGVGMFAFAGLALAFVGGVYLSKTRKSEEC